MPTEAQLTFEASDLELEQQIQGALDKLQVASLRRVLVDVRQGIVALSGEVNSFYAKQLAQHSARRFAGDSRVIDEVRVSTPADLRTSTRLSRATAVALALFAALLVGCSKPQVERVAVHPVSGQVTLNGRPAAGALVVFHAKQPADAPPPRAQADSSGNFQLSTFAGADGAPAGEYVITVELRPLMQKDGEFVPGPNQVPPKYTQPKTSSLTAQVVEGENNVPIKILR